MPKQGDKAKGIRKRKHPAKRVAKIHRKKGPGKKSRAGALRRRRKTHAPGPKKTAPGKGRKNMKPPPPIQPIKDRFPALEEQEVLLSFYAPEAKVVQVAGTFNGWCPEASPLGHTGYGEWAVRLMLKSGQYEYRFVVDGVWTDEPEPAQSAVNPYGGHNSVLKVGLDDRADLL
jgi:hypothetical protein